MAPLATTRSIVRRLTDADRPRLAVALMVAASATIFGLVIVALPSPAAGLDVTPVVDAPAAADGTDTRLVDAADELVLQTPTEDAHRGSTIVNHRRPGITLDAKLANGEGLAVELVDEGDRTTRVVVTSEAVHRCGRYAGTLILTASHPSGAADLLVLDIRFAECSDTRVPTLAGSSVNDLSPTWAEEGRAPWKPRVVTPPPAPAPPPAPEPEPEPVEAEPTTAPEPEPTASSPEPEPTRTTRPPGPEPEPTPTSEPEPTTEPTATSEPTSEPTATSEPTTEPTTGDGGGETSPATESPTTADTSTASETSTEG